MFYGVSPNLLSLTKCVSRPPIFKFEFLSRVNQRSLRKESNVYRRKSDTGIYPKRDTHSRGLQRETHKFKGEEYSCG